MFGFGGRAKFLKLVMLFAKLMCAGCLTAGFVDALIPLDVGTPSALWDATVVDVPGGQPSSGVRTAVYSGSVVPQYIMLPLLYTPNTTSPPAVQVQYRVTSTTSYVLPFNGLFYANWRSSCINVSVVQNGRLVTVGVDSMSYADVTALAGALLTCNWGVYPAVTDVQNLPSMTELEVFPPAYYDAVDYFDLLVWTSNVEQCVWAVVRSWSMPADWMVNDDPNSQMRFPWSGVDYTSNGFVDGGWIGGYVVINATSSETRYMSILPIQPDVGFNGSASVTLHGVTAADASTFASSYCRLNNVDSSYFMERVPAGAAVLGTVMNYTTPPIPRCIEGATYTAAHMMQECDNDPMCAGFFTTARNRGVETGRCFLMLRALNISATATPDIDVVRLVHWRRHVNLLDAAIGCEVVVEAAVDVAVYVQAPSVEVAVLVNEQTALSCVGATSRFTSSDPYTLCGVVSGLLAGWKVRVVVTRVNTLDWSSPTPMLQVLFNSSLSGSGTTTNLRTPAAGLPLVVAKASAATLLASSTFYRDVVVYKGTTSLSLYAVRLTSLKILVQQSSFRMSSSRSYAIYASTTGMRCGGAAGFASSRVGWGPRCDVWAECPPYNISGVFTGAVTLAIDWDTITDQAGSNATWCKDRNIDSVPTPSIVLRFFAEVSASAPDTPGGWLGTTTPAASDAALAPLVLVPTTAATAPSSDLADMNTTSPYKYLQDAVLHLANMHSYIPRSSYVLSGDELLGCGVDTVGGNSVACVFPLHAATTLVSLRVEDANLADVSVAWMVQAVNVTDGTSSTIRSGLCGGTAGYADGSAANGNCGSLRTCISFRTDSVLYSGKVLRLVVTVPKAVMQPAVVCPPYAFFALVNTTTSPQPVVLCDNFVCASTGACVPLSRVCDGVSDCGDGSDEEHCFDWYAVELNSVLTLPVIFNTSSSSVPAGFTVASMKGCRALALRNDSNAIAYNDLSGECVVYNFTSPTTDVYELTTVAQAQPSFTVYAVLSNPLQYGVCTDRLSCNGHGTAGLVFTQRYCGCSCDEGYTGSACASSVSIAVDYKTFAIEFPVDSSSAFVESLNSTSVVSTLKRWMPQGLFACGTALRTSATTLAIICTDNSGRVGSGDVGSPNARETFNSNFVSFGPTGLAASSLAATTAPQLELLTGCQYGLDNYYCQLPAAASIGALAVTMITFPPTTVATATLALNLTVVASSTRRRSGASTSRVVTVLCPPDAAYSTTIPILGIISFTCSFDFISNATNLDPITEISVFVIDSDGVSVVQAVTSPSYLPSMMMRRTLSIPALETNNAPVTIEENFSIWLWCGIALIGLGVVIAIVVVSLAVIYRSHVQRVVQRTQQDATIGRLQKVVTMLYLQLTRVEVDDPLSDDDDMDLAKESTHPFDADATVPTKMSVIPSSSSLKQGSVGDAPKCKIERLRPSTAFPNTNRRRRAFCCSSFWLLTWIAAVFVLLYYVTSDGIQSDTWLVVERYSDATCERSAFSGTPSAVFIVSDDTATNCERRKVAGDVQSGIYFSGYCTANTTDGVSSSSAIVRLRLGDTKAACEDAEYVDVPADSCFDSGSLWGSNSTMSFTRFSCATIASSSSRFDYLQELTSQTQPALQTRVEMSDTSLSTLTSGPSGGIQRPLLRQTGRAAMVATSDAHFDTTGMGSTLFPTQGQQLYLQVDATDTAELFMAPNEPSFFSPATSSVEAAYQSRLVDFLLDPAPLAQLVDHLPRNQLPELPIGQIYGYMNRSTQLVGASAGTTSSRYYGARRSVVDIGAFIDTSTMKDGQGFTISANLRATTETYGFAYAVTDAMVNLQSGTSPILDQMISILLRNAGVDEWFTDDFHIYHSLFVDGPGRQLQFIYAFPAQVFGATQYDANTNRSIGKTLGILTWDLSALNLERLLNGVWHNVRLVVRMEINTLKVQLIVDGETSRSAPGWNQCLLDDPRPIYRYTQGQYVATFNITNQVGTDAMLWTGYLNGGVGDLRYIPLVEDIFDIWREASPVVQKFNGIDQKRYIMLGYIMCVAGIVLFIMMILTSGRDLYLEAKRAERARVQGVFLRYVNIISSMPGHYAFLKYTTAKRWLGLSDTQLMQFLDEVQNTTTAVPLELHRVLYLAGLALLTNEPRDIARPLPPRSAWAKLIEEDEAKYVWDHTRRFPWVSEGTPEVDPYHIPTKGGTDASSTGVGGLPTNARDEGEEIVASEMAFTAAVKAQATFKQEGETGAVNTGNLTFTTGGTATASQLSMKSDSLPSVNIDLRQLFLPLIGVVQEVHLWVSSSQMVQDYLHIFQQAFSFISIDFVTSFSLPTLITPVVQLLVGLLAFLVLLYLSSMDEVWFSWYVARYVLKRDALEMGSTDDTTPDAPTTAPTNPLQGRQEQQQGDRTAAAPAYVKRIMERFHDPFGTFTEFPFEYEVEVLPLKESMRLDRFLGVSSVGKDDGDELQQGEEGVPEITVMDHKHREFTLSKNSASDSRKGVDKAPFLGVMTDAPGAQSCTLNVVGVRCREHKSRRLAPQLQTDIWPFVLAPECCVVSNGVRCGASQGIVYSCQQQKDTNDGSLCLCDYALCERHYRGGLVDGITAEALGAVRTGLSRGPQWIVATVAVLGANAVYMPFVQTALMILGCHPVYQCEFTECSITNQKFLLAAFLACCVIALFGLGLPLMQALQINRRRRTLLHVFFADEYNGRYEEKDDTAQDEKTMLEKLQRSEAAMGESGDMGASSFRASSHHHSRNVALRKRKQVTKKDSTMSGAGMRETDTDGADLNATTGTLGASVLLPYTGIGAEESMQVETDGTMVVELVSPVKTTPGPLPAPPTSSLPTISPMPSHSGGASPRGNRMDTSLSWVNAASPKKPVCDSTSSDFPGNDTQRGDAEAPKEDAFDSNKGGKIVLLSEWGRFLASDPTVLGNLYKALEFEWIYLSPILLLWKVVLVCPAVFLPSSTFEQLVGICATEVGFALFIFITAPFSSSMADLMYKAGNCHQVLFLGVRALDTVARYEGGAGYGFVFLLLTFVYLAFSIACIAWTVVGAQVRKATDRSRSTKALEGLGFQYAPSTSLYVVPALDGVRRFSRASDGSESDGDSQQAAANGDIVKKVD